VASADVARAWIDDLRAFESRLHADIQQLFEALLADLEEAADLNGPAGRHRGVRTTIHQHESRLSRLIQDRLEELTSGPAPLPQGGPAAAQVEFHRVYRTRLETYLLDTGRWLAEHPCPVPSGARPLTRADILRATRHVRQQLDELYPIQRPVGPAAGGS
jgi:hypothetical protein